MAGVDKLKHLDPEGFSTQAAAVVISRTGVGIGIGVLLGLGVYLGFVHLGSRRRAYGLRLRIDGMFLHLVRDGITREDRKIHFNKISDYAVTDGPIMRLCGIRGLFIVGTSMSPASLMFIPGVIDAERIRDTLCLIDRQREDRQS